MNEKFDEDKILDWPVRIVDGNVQHSHLCGCGACRQSLDTIEKKRSREVWQLARLAGVHEPDRSSPGANFLRQVERAFEDLSRELGSSVLDEDELLVLADDCVPVYTYERWQVFVDLCAWEVDISDYGYDADNMTTLAGIALYNVAESLLYALRLDMQKRKGK